MGLDRIGGYAVGFFAMPVVGERGGRLNKRIGGERDEGGSESRRYGREG